MKRSEKTTLLTGIGFLTAFLLWTVLIQLVDVQPAGPNGTGVGFAAFNLWFHRLTGVHMTLYSITDWLGLVPVLVCLCFGALGAMQLIRRRSLLRVDPDILLLGLYYLLVIFAYLFFEMVPINYRPTLIHGALNGLCGLALIRSDRPAWNRRRLAAGMALSVLDVAVMIAARQPYAGLLCFALLVVKAIGKMKLRATP